MTRFILDAGAFVAFERGDPLLRGALEIARKRAFEVTTVSPVIAQVWRDGRRQARIARLLDGTRVEAPGESAARRAGELLARTGTTDVVDALVVGLARNGDTIVTSDPDDIESLLAAARVSAALLRV